MPKSFLLLMITAIFISGCSSAQQHPPEFSECSKDSDCMKTGCSGQLCVPVSSGDVITTCEYRDEYECLRETSCGCINGQCAWEQTREYTDCMERLK